MVEKKKRKSWQRRFYASFLHSRKFFNPFLIYLMDFFTFLSRQCHLLLELLRKGFTYGLQPMFNIQHQDLSIPFRDSVQYIRIEKRIQSNKSGLQAFSNALRLTCGNLCMQKNEEIFYKIVRVGKFFSTEKKIFYLHYYDT